MRATEERQLAELFLDLKGKKQKRLDWIAIAERCSALAGRYRSVHELAEKVGVSDHLIRSIVSLLKLPPDVQDLVRKGEILYDAGYRLNTLSSAARQSQVAKIIAGLPSHVQREIIQHAKNNPDADLTDFRRRLTDKPVKREKVHLVVLPLMGQEFRDLRRLSQQRGMSVQDVVLQALREYVSNSGEE